MSRTGDRRTHASFILALHGYLSWHTIPCLRAGHASPPRRSSETSAATYKTPAGSPSISRSDPSKATIPLVHLFDLPPSMASTLPCRPLLLPLPSLDRHRRRPCRTGAAPTGHDGGGWGRRSPARVRTGRGGRRDAGRFCARGLFGAGDGFRSVRRLVRLNSAVQNRSVRELLELIGDECMYFFGDLRSMDVSQLGKDTFLLLHALMVRHHVALVLKPTQEEPGFDLGIKWSLEWKGKKLPWDLDCNVSTSHVYRGLLLFSQVNQSCGPLLGTILGTIQQSLDAVIPTIVGRVLPEGTLDEKSGRTICCVAIGLVVMALLYAVFRNT